MAKSRIAKTTAQDNLRLTTLGKKRVMEKEKKNNKKIALSTCRARGIKKLCNLIIHVFLVACVVLLEKKLLSAEERS
jgi:hypothetical protein